MGNDDWPSGWWIVPAALGSLMIAAGIAGWWLLFAWLLGVGIGGWLTLWLTDRTGWP